MTHTDRSSEDIRFQDSIAQARMLAERGQHEQAMELCRELIRERPDSGPAHAAMGDVCAADSRWHEAIDWYEQALNLSFDPQVMERLAAARSRAIRSGPDDAQASAATAPPGAARDERGLSPQIVGLVVIGVLMVTLLAFFMARGLSRPPDVTTAAVDPSRVQVRPPPPGPPPAPAPTPTQPQAVVPSAPTPRPTATPRPTTPTPRPTARPDRTPPTAEPISTREQRILDQVHFVRLQATGATRLPAAMALDDYSGVGILTFRIYLPDSLAGLQQELALAAFRAAAAAMRTDPGLKTLVVRYVARVPGEDGEEEDEEHVTIFRATALRDRLQPWIDRAETPDAEQLRTEVLTDVWLNQAALERHVRSRNAARAAAAPSR